MISSQGSVHVNCTSVGEDVPHVKQDFMVLQAVRCLDAQVCSLLNTVHINSFPK